MMKINYTIPKKENIGCTLAINETSYEYKEILNIITKLCFIDKNPLANLKLHQAMLITNKKLESNYNEKKIAMKRDGNVLETYAFLFCTQSQAETIAKDGMKCCNIGKSILGDNIKGVHLYRFLDICTLDAITDNWFNKVWSYGDKNSDIKYGALVIFKVLLGKLFPVNVNEQLNNIEPSPLHDAHVTDSKPNIKDKGFVKRNKSLIYFYEYDLVTMTTKDYPRQILPYAYLNFIKPAPPSYKTKEESIYNQTIKKPVMAPIHKKETTLQKMPDASEIISSSEKEIKTIESPTENDDDISPDTDYRFYDQTSSTNEPESFIKQETWSVNHMNGYPDNEMIDRQQTEVRMNYINQVFQRFMCDLRMENFNFCHFLYSCMLKLMTILSAKVDNDKDKFALDHTITLFMDYVLSCHQRGNQVFTGRDHLNHELLNVVSDIIDSNNANYNHVKNEYIHGVNHHQIPPSSAYTNLNQYGFERGPYESLALHTNTTINSTLQYPVDVTNRLYTPHQPATFMNHLDNNPINIKDPRIATKLSKDLTNNTLSSEDETSKLTIDIGSPPTVESLTTPINNSGILPSAISPIDNTATNASSSEPISNIKRLKTSIKNQNADFHGRTLRYKELPFIIPPNSRSDMHDPRTVLRGRQNPPLLTKQFDAVKVVYSK